MMTQAPNVVTTNLIPQNFTEILAILGGFVTLVTKMIGWGIKSYQIFQYRKSSVKKLYYYTRTKKKESHRNKYLITDSSGGASKKFTDPNMSAESHPQIQKIEENQTHEDNFKILKTVILSKAILSYGYLQSFKIFVHQCFVNRTFKCCRRYLCCARQKVSSANKI
jgi:hypothetical protein